MSCRGYAIGVLVLFKKTREFTGGLVATIQGLLGTTPPTYPDYVDPGLVEGQQSYWGFHLTVLESIKSRWEPEDIFYNPQSVRSLA